MEEKKLPWWRRALSVALDGLRSGFGLFARSQKEETSQGAKSISGLQEDFEIDIDLTEHSPALKQVYEVVTEAGAAPVIEFGAADEIAAAAQQPEVALLPVEETPEAEAVASLEVTSEPQIQEQTETIAVAEEPVVEELLRSVVEEPAEIEEDAAEMEMAPKEIEVKIPSKVPPLSTSAMDAKAVVVDECASSDTLELEEPIDPVAKVEELSVADAAPGANEESALVAEPQAVDEEVAVAVKEVSEVEPVAVVVEEEPAVEMEAAAAPETEETVVKPPAVESEQVAEETEEQAQPESELTQEPIVETGEEQEPLAEMNPVDEPVTEIAEANEPAEAIAEPEVETAMEAESGIEVAVETEGGAAGPDDAGSEDVAAVVVDEPMQDVDAMEAIEALEAKAKPETEIEVEPETELAAEIACEAEPEKELATVGVPLPELSASPVELNEPAAEVAPEMQGVHEDADEADEVVEESQEATPEHEAVDESVAETAEETEPATEEDTESARGIVAAGEIAPASEIEDLSETMELNEPISDPILGAATEPATAGESTPDAETVPTVESEPSEVAAEAEVEMIEAAAEPVTEGAMAAETAPHGPACETPEQTAAEPAPEPEAEDEPAITIASAPPEPHKPSIKLESRDNEEDLSPFSVIVSQVYDGPLDLLLDLIRKQDIDIYDIPIARITAQFLAYVNQLKSSDVDVAGEFIYTASLLIHIKSKMLLPRAPSGPEDAAEDPRRELVERLLEHERFKNAAQMLQQKQMLEAATWTNPGLREFKDDEGTEPEIAADTVDLVRVFRDILERARNRPVINVEEDSVTVGQMIQFLSRRLTMEDKPIALHQLLSQTKSERALIAMFLALLELVRLQAILLRQDRAFSEIFIKKNTAFESVMNEGLANARDNWQ